ncbi:MAG: lamin tail domain-containing protein, partial [Candidatus Colwellbacteria bacterium]|nr:lamin tail domain-containing protein [Candidatus Colwellbacteria bacterium]
MFNSPDDNLIAEIPVGDNKSEEKQQITKPFVFVDKTSVYPGEIITESGSGFSPGAEIILFFSLPSGKTASASVVADQNGQFNHDYTIHPSAETGIHYYWAEDKIAGFVTDKVKYLIVSPSEKKPESAEIAEINDQSDGENKEDNEREPLILPKECSFSASGSATGGKRIILNEVAWMGSTESSNGEWIELKNISSSEVDVSGWWLIDQAEQIRVVFPNNTQIPAGRFYLLERGDDDAIPDVKADLIYTGTLSNTKEGLRLLNPNCLIEDEVSANPDWPAGDSTGRKTMERKSDYSGWHTSVFIDGTPKQENSAGTAVEEDKKKSEFISPGGSSSVSYCSQSNLSSPSNEVLINEVAWAGDAESSSNEWIELYNPGETEVSLIGWQLLDKAENIKIVFGSGDKIMANGYFLAVRGSENFIPGIMADRFYSGSINNSDETLRLFNGNCALVDEIKDTGSNWKNIGGSAGPDYKTAERLGDGSWHSFSGPSGMIMGTPKAANSPKIIGVEDGEENEEEEEDDGSGSSWGSSSDKLVISEIMPGLTGSPDDEFIELYNPTENDISLDGWYLAKKATMASEPVSLVSKSSELFNGRIIPPKSFFLVASQNYSGSKVPDIIYSQSSSHLANNGDVIVFYNHQDEPALITEYESVEMGKSLERKAFVGGVCFQSIGEYEFSGNGCSADDTVIWNIRSNPNPQNLASLPEPRNKPIWPFTSSDISVLYNPEKIAIDVVWPSFIGTVRISDDDGSLWSGSGIEGKNKIKIYELGKEQNIYFEIVDEDGLASADKASFSVIAPRLISDYKLYAGLKYDFDEKEEERNIIEFSWGSFPFIPQDIGLALPYGESPGPNFKVMVLYKNMDVPDDKFLYYEHPRPEYADNAIGICYRDENYYDCRKRIIFSDSGSMEYYSGAPFSQQIRPDFYLTEGDNHLVLPADNIQPGDYFTVGYYAFYRSYPSGTAEEESSKSFILVAKDNNRITFGSMPSHNPPSAPANLRSETQVKDGGEGLSTRLLTFWDDSMDSDTRDRLIRYEISYDSGATWNRG